MVDSHSLGGHPQTEVNALGLPWHVGLERSTGAFRIGYDELTAMPEPTQRENKIAVVCSNASASEGQRVNSEAWLINRHGRWMDDE